MSLTPKKLESSTINLLLGMLLTSPVTLLSFPATAQSTAQNKENNIVEQIIVESEGNIDIDIPDNILEEILKQPQQSQSSTVKKQNTGSTYKKGVNRVEGYRVMIFSDSKNPASLQARARSRGNAVAAKLPKYRGQVYTYNKSPNWYCTVGNFTNSAEAARALAELKRAFPAFAAEMRVVKSQITIK